MSRVSMNAACVLVLALAAASQSGCGGGGGGLAKFVDRHPLPMDTLTVAMDELGSHGGRFVVGATSSPRTLNPIIATESSSTELLGQMFVALADIDYRTQADIPALAKSWVSSPDGRTFTFRLRRGARFSDGHPITSDDVKFSFDVAMDSTLHSSIRDALWLRVDGVDRPFAYEASDSFTFVVTAPGPDALMLAHVSNVRILPRHVLEPAYREGRFASAYSTSTPPESLVSSGPWRLKSYVESQQSVLERNPYWYGVDARGRRLPYLDELVFRVAKDQDAAAQMFHAGELDGLDNVKSEDYRQYAAEQESKGFTLYDIGPSFNTNFFWFNLNRVRAAAGGRKIGAPEAEPYKFAWFSNRDFRRAVSMAVDRDAMIRGPFFGHATKEWSLLTSGNPRWRDSTITVADYDPAQARALLDAIGMRDTDGDGVREDAAGHPVSFTLLFNGDNKLRASIAALLQDDLGRVGIRLIPTGVDFNSLVTRFRSERKYDACLMGAASSIPADPGMGANFWMSSGLSHYWHIGQPEGRPGTPAEARIDALFQRNISTLDMAQRKATYREMAQILNDECFLIWLPTPRMRIPVRNAFGNVHPSPLPHRILWNSDRIFHRGGGKGA